MLLDLADGWRDAVIVYHPDRLTRRPIELEHFVEVVTGAGISHVQFVAGAPVDLASGDGLLVLRMLGAVAANESASKSRRVRRKLDEVAASGRPHGGSNRPFGYESDCITIRPDEAEVIRQLVARFLAGDSLRSLATWLDEQGVPTVNGGAWKSPTVRGMLASGRIAGLRRHRGEIVGPAAWKPIISEFDHNKIVARLAEAASTGRRTPRSYLLTGLLRCGKCGNKLFSSRRENTRRYVCMSGPDHGGCGRLTINAAPLEELITQAVLYRLDTPELADRLSGRGAADEHTAALAEALAADRTQLDELANVYAQKLIGVREWIAARGPIQARIQDNERLLARMSQSDALAGFVGNGDQLRAQWSDLNLTRQHAIVKAILDHAVIGPGSHGTRGVDPSRVDPVWRL
jgi:hypothetical protein